MTTSTAVPAARVPVRGSSAPPGKRLASSVRLPWLVGLASLLMLAFVVGVLAGRGTSTEGVVHAVLDAEQAVAVGAASSVRRSLNEGVDDLEQAARALAPAGAVVDVSRAQTVLRATASEHGRYAALGLVDARTGRFVLPVSGERPPPALGSLPDDQPSVRVLEDGRLVQAVPVQDGRGLLVGAVYDPAFLVPALLPAPDALFIVDHQGRSVTAPGAQGLGRPLPDPVLAEQAELARESGADATAVRTGPERARVVAAAPLTGVGPGGRAGLVVVSSREVPAPVGGGNPFRLPGVLAAVVLAVVAGALFAWLRVAVLRPLLRLQTTAERVGYGDLSRPVEVDRYDEVGAVGRAFERLRLALIRAEVQDLAPRREKR